VEADRMGQRRVDPTARTGSRAVLAVAGGAALTLPFAASAMAAPMACACGGGGGPEAPDYEPDPVTATTTSQPTEVEAPEPPPAHGPEPPALEPAAEPAPPPASPAPEPQPQVYGVDRQLYDALGPEDQQSVREGYEHQQAAVSAPASTSGPDPEPAASSEPDPARAEEPAATSEPGRGPVPEAEADTASERQAPPAHGAEPPEPEPTSEPARPPADPAPEPSAAPQPRIYGVDADLYRRLGPQDQQAIREDHEQAPAPIPPPRAVPDEPEPAVPNPPDGSQDEPMSPAAPQPRVYGVDADLYRRLGPQDQQAIREDHEQAPAPTAPAPTPAPPAAEPAMEPADPPGPPPYAGMAADAAEQWAESGSSSTSGSSSAAGDAADPAVHHRRPPTAPRDDPKPVEHQAARPTPVPSLLQPAPEAAPPEPETLPDLPEPSSSASKTLHAEGTVPTGWCPLGNNPNGSCRGSGAASAGADIAGDVTKRGWHVTRFAVTAPITAPTWVYAEMNGGNCGFDPGLVVGCYDVNDWAVPRGALTVGGAALYEDEANDVSDAKRAHEEGHTDQAALFGPLALPYLYLANEAVSQGTGHGPCWNLFEWWAGFEEGGYDKCE
jgi:hypothetical protein